MRTPLKAVLALCVVTGLSACGNGDDSASAASAPPPPTVSVVTLNPETVSLAPEYPGRTAGSHEVQVRARVEGILLERHYVEGSAVEAGEVLFHIDPAPFEVDLARAQARLQQANARLEAATRDRDRAAPLIERDVISIQAWDDLRSALQLAEADVAAAQAEVDAARINLGYTTVRAPIAGVTSREAVSEGSLVGPQSQSLLTTIVRTEPLYVWFSYPESELQTLDALTWGSGKGSLGAELILPGGEVYAHQGLVNFTDSTIDSATGTVQARAEFPNPERRLRPGQFVRVRLLGLALENTLLVPQEAVMQSPQGTFVYRVDEQQRAQYTPIEIGQAVGSRWEVREGLAAGDRVVSVGLLKVEPGALIDISGGAPAQPGGGTGLAQP